MFLSSKLFMTDNPQQKPCFKPVVFEFMSALDTLPTIPTFQDLPLLKQIIHCISLTRFVGCYFMRLFRSRRLSHVLLDHAFIRTWHDNG